MKNSRAGAAFKGRNTSKGQGEICSNSTKSTTSRMDVPDRGRNERIVALREQGITYQEIAAIFKISRARVGQICLREKEKMRDRDSVPTLGNLVCQRVRNALQHNVYNQKLLEDPQKIAALGSARLLRIKNIGRKSIKELARALLRLGVIREDDQWYIPPESQRQKKGRPRSVFTCPVKWPED
jgi:DNA-binding CsgD family transcriptional regulator